MLNQHSWIEDGGTAGSGRKEKLFVVVGCMGGCFRLYVHRRASNFLPPSSLPQRHQLHDAQRHTQSCECELKNFSSYRDNIIATSIVEWLKYILDRNLSQERSMHRSHDSGLQLRMASI